MVDALPDADAKKLIGVTLNSSSQNDPQRKDIALVMCISAIKTLR